MSDPPPVAQGGDPKFFGDGRFVVIRPLGAGGMGTVYEVLERETGERVALKQLHSLDALDLYLFKNEFRALTGLEHPNLVRLRDMFVAQGDWCFTMDRVKGVPFLDFVWGEEASPTTTSTGSRRTLRRDSTGTAPTLAHTSRPGAAADGDPARPTDAGGRPPVPVSVLDADSERRLRQALPQLVEGIHALHCFGKLHRDLKPSNVLIDADGHAVLLDFGLVQERGAEIDSGELVTAGQVLVGTLRYMSPEQAAGHPLEPASDWYSLGVMLYEALTGGPPHESGTLEGLLLAKISQTPTSPRDLDPNLPRDLVTLCVDLLCIEPDDRPTAEALYERLGLGEPPRPRSVEGSGARFVGRAEQLATLELALARVAEGTPVSVSVLGRSGVGKSTLTRRFLARVSESEAIVLSGRCFERDAVPFKALDPIVDALAKHLATRSQGTLAELIPEGLGTLPSLFPILSSVGRGTRRPSATDSVTFDDRAEAFEALRGLVDRVARHAPLVVHIDDFQWIDADSLIGLQHLLRSPDPPPFLLVLGVRSEQASASGDVEDFFEFLREQRSANRHLQIELGPLSDDDGVELVRRLLPANVAPVATLARTIVHEARGLPILIEELTRHAESVTAGSLDDDSTSDLALDGLVAARLMRLPEPARDLLETLAVAERPVAQKLAWQAARIGTRGSEIIDALSRQLLVRTHGRRPEDLIECYHSSIARVAVQQMSDGNVVDRHLSLADAMDVAGAPDPEQMYRHLWAGGRRAQAVPYLRATADKAFEALAFEQAIDLYRQYLGIIDADPGEIDELRLRLADVLAAAGRGPEAADVYLDVATRRSDEEVWSLELKAAGALLETGHLDRGVDLLRGALRTVGLAVPQSSAGTLAKLLGLRAQLALRGIGFKERPEESVPPELLSQIDVCCSASIGVGMAYPIEGAVHQLRALLLSLRSGEPVRVAVSLSAEAGYRATEGASGYEYARKLDSRAWEILEEHDVPGARAGAAMTRALIEYQVGHWRPCREWAERSLEILSSNPVVIAAVRTMAEIFAWGAASYLGDLSGAAAAFDRVVMQARHRKDLFTEIMFRTGGLIPHYLISDQPERAAKDVKEAITQWPGEGYSMYHNYAERTLGQIALYRGDAAGALETSRSCHRHLASSPMKRVSFMRTFCLDLGARACLIAVRQGHDRDKLLREVAGNLKLLRKENLPWATALAELAEAQVTLLAGDESGAIEGFDRAAHAFDDAHMRLHAVVARWRRDESGAGNGIAAARDEIVESGAANPEAMARMIAPVTSDRAQ